MRLPAIGRGVVTAAVCALTLTTVRTARAQDISSFAAVAKIFNVTAQREAPISPTDHHYSIQLGTGAYFQYSASGPKYYISNIFGFALLSDAGTLNANPNPPSPQNGDWVYKEQFSDNTQHPNTTDYMSGFFESQGHTTNSLLPGQPKLTFDFSKNLDNNDTTPFDAYGIHATWYTDKGLTQNGNTGYLRFNDSVVVAGGNPTPEPAFYQSAALFGMGGLGLLRLRRRKSS